MAVQFKTVYPFAWRTAIKARNWSSDFFVVPNVFSTVLFVLVLSHVWLTRAHRCHGVSNIRVGRSSNCWKPFRGTAPRGAGSRIGMELTERSSREQRGGSPSEMF